MKKINRTKTAKRKPTSKSPKRVVSRILSRKAVSSKTHSVKIKTKTKKKRSLTRGQKRLSDRVLEMMKNIILDKREKALEEMGYIREKSIDDFGNIDTTTRDSIYSFHMADAGTDAQEREKSFLWLTRENSFIKHLDKALMRVRNKTYGFCIVCDEPIPMDRLKEVPHTQHCVRCKNKENR